MLCCLVLAGPVQAAELSTREGDHGVAYRVTAEQLTPTEAHAARTPLGSVWKLFVYSYLLAEEVSSSDYVCRGGDPEEVYCCAPGGQIDRDAALIRSCGRYFAPTRLGIDATAWARFWQHRGGPAWLARLAMMDEATEVDVDSLLDALDAVPAPVRERAGLTLLGLLDSQAAGDTLRHTGGRLRAKTWTLPTPDGGHQGGAAGWFANGQPFWLGGRGAGIAVLREAAPALGRYLDGLPVPDESACVDVRFFARYPIDAIVPTHAGQSTRGPLRGRYRVRFANGNQIDIASNGELRAESGDGHPEIIGRLGLNDYVARVIDREGGATPRTAARALAVVARSYLLDNARPGAPCFVIDDSSRYQRVAPRPASAAARAVADWSTGLALSGTPVNFHHDQAAPGVLSWTDAVARARQGQSFDQILRIPFPTASLGGRAGNAEQCQTTPEASGWLSGRVRRWRAQLMSQAGYIEPIPLPTLCLTHAPRPFADRARNRIYIRGWSRTEDRVAIAHEYLHLAFDGHPTANDEDRIESLARQLILSAAP